MEPLAVHIGLGRLKLLLSLLLDLGYLLASALTRPWFIYRVMWRGDSGHCQAAERGLPRGIPCSAFRNALHWTSD